MRPTDADRRAESKHLESFEARILEMSEAMSQARGIDRGVAASSLVVAAFKRYGELYDASRADGARGQPLAWRIGYAVARWVELTKDAIPARAI